VSTGGTGYHPEAQTIHNTAVNNPLVIFFAFAYAWAWIVFVPMVMWGER
jgi:hypothetical protein